MTAALVAMTVGDVSDALARAARRPKQARDGATIATCPSCESVDALEVRRVAGGKWATIACAKDCDGAAIVTALGLSAAQAVTPERTEPRRRQSAVSKAPVPRSRTLVTIAAADVEPLAVRWLWSGRVPFGKVTLIEGQPGLGKTLAVIDLAARVSSGSAMPLQNLPAADGGRPVLIASYEDDAADTLRPRLEAAGANLSLCHIVTGVLDSATGDTVPPLLPVDLSLVREHIIRTRAALVIVDPLMAALGADVDAHRDQDVRRVLSRVRSLAESTGAAIVLVRHLRKAATPGQAITAGQGSIGIVGAARTAHVIAPDPDDAERRIFAPVKSNVGQLPRALAYRISTRIISHGIEAPHVEWLAECDATADSLTGAPHAADDGGGALSDAIDWLRGELGSGERRVRDLQAATKDAGLHWRTVERAKRRLGVLAGKLAYRDGWGWRLPRSVNAGSVAAFAKTATNPAAQVANATTKTANDYERRQRNREEDVA